MMNPMTRNDIYSRPIERISERQNTRLAKFVNVPVKEVNGTCLLAYEGVPINNQDIWTPDKDWNQLMLIIDEIEKIDNIQLVIKGSHCFIARLKSTIEAGQEIIEPTILCQFDGGSRLESVYRCCVDFVVNVAI